MTNKRIEKIFEDLEHYLKFCKEFGFVFNEKDLYKSTTPWGLYAKHRNGGHVYSNWDRDARR